MRFAELITALNQRWSDPDFITYADISLQMRKIITDAFSTINLILDVKTSPPHSSYNSKVPSAPLTSLIYASAILGNRSEIGLIVQMLHREI